MKEIDAVLELSYDHRGHRIWAEAFENQDGKFGGKYRIDDSTSGDTRFVTSTTQAVVLSEVFDRAIDARTAASEAAMAAVDEKLDG